MFGLGGQEFVLIYLILIIIAVPVLVLFSLIDALRSEFTGYNKIIWILLILFFPVIGSLLYFFIGQKQKISS
jgi:hypothetical protein